jgi:hypothetical protein
LGNAGFLSVHAKRCSITFELPSQLSFARAHSVRLSGGRFQFRELGAFFRTLPAGFAATGKRLNSGRDNVRS